MVAGIGLVEEVPGYESSDRQGLPVILHRKSGALKDLSLRSVKGYPDKSTTDAQARKLARNFTSCFFRRQSKLQALESTAECWRFSDVTCRRPRE